MQFQQSSFLPVQMTQPKRFLRPKFKFSSGFWFRACLLAGLLATVAPSAQAQLSKGYRILLNRGLQLQGLVQWNDYFHLDTYTNAGYSSINWGWTSSPSLLDATAGTPWSRWVSGTTNMPPQSGEAPYLNQLIALQLGDE